VGYVFCKKMNELAVAVGPQDESGLLSQAFVIARWLRVPKFATVSLTLMIAP